MSLSKKQQLNVFSVSSVKLALIFVFFVTCLIFAMHHCASLMYAIAISSCHMVVLILDTVDDIGWDRMSLSVIGFVLHNVF